MPGLFITGYEQLKKEIASNPFFKKKILCSSKTGNDSENRKYNCGANPQSKLTVSQ
jgi:hypothetical protein